MKSSTVEAEASLANKNKSSYGQKFITKEINSK
jgi:hypothetical protein